MMMLPARALSAVYVQAAHESLLPFMRDTGRLRRILRLRY